MYSLVEARDDILLVLNATIKFMCFTLDAQITAHTIVDRYLLRNLNMHLAVNVR